MVFYISIADDFFDPVHDGFIADSFHIFSSLRQNSNKVGITNIVRRVEFVGDQNFSLFRWGIILPTISKQNLYHEKENKNLIFSISCVASKFEMSENL